MTEGRAELAAADSRPACARLTSSARALLASDCRAACRAADADARAAIMDAVLLLLLLALGNLTFVLYDRLIPRAQRFLETRLAAFLR